MKKTIVLGAFAALSAAAHSQYMMFSEPQKVGGTVNQAETEESIPVFSKDSSTLYFVRLFDASNKGGITDQDIWYSKRNADGSYSDCKQMKGLNNKYNNAVVGLNKDGSAIYLLNSYEGKKDTVKGIAMSEFSGGGWSKPDRVDVPTLIIEGDFYGFHVSEDENVMIISYAGAGSKGEEDLYVSTRDGGSWSVPQHMGNVINSTGFEISPFLSDNHDTLYFSSNGHGGLGDADIFYSLKQGSWTEWSEPKNMGDMINSPKFDAYFIRSGSRAFWSSNRDGERSDIYTTDILPPPPLTASASSKDVTKHKGADGSIDLTPDGGVEPLTFKWSNGSTVEDPTGLTAGDYSVEITDAVGQVTKVDVTISEPPLELDPVIAKSYENYTFEHQFNYNRSKVSISRGDLRRFVKDVKKQIEEGREKVTIKIIASASHVPTKKFSSNEELAKVRGENMKYDLVDYFTKKNLASNVNVVLVSADVQGPAYEEDASDRSKYNPYQFVKLVTE